MMSFMLEEARGEGHVTGQPGGHHVTTSKKLFTPTQAHTRPGVCLQGPMDAHGSIDDCKIGTRMNATPPEMGA